MDIVSRASRAHVSFAVPRGRRRAARNAARPTGEMANMADMVDIKLGAESSAKPAAPQHTSLPAQPPAVVRAPRAKSPAPKQATPCTDTRLVPSTPSKPHSRPATQSRSMAGQARSFVGAMLHNATQLSAKLYTRAADAMAQGAEDEERVVIAGQYFSLDTQTLRYLGQSPAPVAGKYVPRRTPARAPGPLDAGPRIQAQYAIGPQAVRTLRGHQAEVYSACFAPSGHYLLTASADHTAHLYDLRTGCDSGDFVVLRGHTAPVHFACISPCGHYIVTCAADHTAKLWRTKPGPLVSMDLVEHRGPVLYAQFSTDSRSLVTTSEDGTACLWDLTQAKPRVSLRLMHPGPVRSACFAPDTRAIVCVALGDAQSPRFYPLAHAQPPASRHLRAGLQPTPRASRLWADARGTSHFACLSPNGRLLATASQNQVTIRRASRPADILMTLSGHSEAVSSVAFSPDGQFVATVSEDGMGRLWDVRQRGAKPVLFARHEESIATAAFSPDGRYIATASWDHTAKIYDFDPGD